MENDDTEYWWVVCTVWWKVELDIKSPNREVALAKGLRIYWCSAVQAFAEVGRPGTDTRFVHISTNDVFPALPSRSLGDFCPCHLLPDVTRARVWDTRALNTK